MAKKKVKKKSALATWYLCTLRQESFTGTLVIRASSPVAAEAKFRKKLADLHILIQNDVKVSAT